VVTGTVTSPKCVCVVSSGRPFVLIKSVSLMVRLSATVICDVSTFRTVEESVGTVVGVVVVAVAAEIVADRPVVLVVDGDVVVEAVFCEL
jgi:hypothetical protein